MRGGGPGHWRAVQERGHEERLRPQLMLDRGFTVIELLIVVGIILAVSSVLGPTLRSRRLRANEDAAVAALRAIYEGQRRYAATCAHGGYAVALADLAKPPAGDREGFVPSAFALPDHRAHGYVI